MHISKEMKVFQKYEGISLALFLRTLVLNRVSLIKPTG